MSEVEKKKKRKIGISLTDSVIPIARYSEDANYFLYNKTGCIMDIMQITAKDLQNISDLDIRYDFLKHWKFHKLNGNDYKLIAMNFPCDTSKQQEYFKEKIEKTKNSHQREWQQVALKELQWLRKERTKREYYLMFFSDSPEEHEDFILRNMQIMGTGKEGLLQEIDYEKKCQVLFKMANQNMQVY